MQPFVTFLILGGFVVYATWRIFENQYFIADNGHYHYATPFGNPNFAEWPILGDALHWLAATVPIIGPFFLYPGALILPVPAGFRLTCYYYRKAYYRSFSLDPPGCAVGGDIHSKNYKGESGLMVVQNLHRYFLYAAIGVLGFNLYDSVRSIATPHGFYLGLGVLIMAANVVTLSLYTFSCHSLRHLVGGQLDCFSCTALTRARYGLWSRLTMLNQRHMLWAWVSLIVVAGTDLYIRWVASSGATHVPILGVPV